jgi:hypothetical protein
MPPGRPHSRPGARSRRHHYLVAMLIGVTFRGTSNAPGRTRRGTPVLCSSAQCDGRADLDRRSLETEGRRGRAGRATKARARRGERRTRRRAAAPLVFVGPKGGRLRRSNFRKFWNKARAAVGLDELHFHDLRHTGNTMAVPRKVPASAS